MLVLKLRRGQAARIGPSVTVTVVRNEEGALVIGIDAPPEWKITHTSNPNLTDGPVHHAKPPVDRQQPDPAR